MERAHIYFMLAGALANRGINSASIEKYGQLWDSITSADYLPCPLCFTYAGKHSALKPLPNKAGETLRCQMCLTVFNSLLPCG
jgi:hypothetical protein